MTTSYQEALIKERDAEINKIAGEMSEIHKIQCSIAEMIEEQSYVVDTLSTHIKESRENVEESKDNLLEAEKSSDIGNKTYLALALAAITTVGITIIGTIL